MLFNLGFATRFYLFGFFPSATTHKKITDILQVFTIKCFYLARDQ